MTEMIIALGGGAGIAAILTALAMILRQTKELSPNHGGSVKDKATKAADNSTTILDFLHQLDKRISEDSRTSHEYRESTSNQFRQIIEIQRENREDIKELRSTEARQWERIEKLEDKISTLGTLLECSERK